MLLLPSRRLCTAGRNSSPSGWYHGSWLSSLCGTGAFLLGSGRASAGRPYTPGGHEMNEWSDEMVPIEVAVVRYATAISLRVRGQRRQAPVDGEIMRPV